jgi:hypothetical protein
MAARCASAVWTPLRVVVVELDATWVCTLGPERIISATRGSEYERGDGCGLTATLNALQVCLGPEF